MLSILLCRRGLIWLRLHVRDDDIDILSGLIRIRHQVHLFRVVVPRSKRRTPAVADILGRPVSEVLAALEIGLVGRPGRRLRLSHFVGRAAVTGLTFRLAPAPDRIGTALERRLGDGREILAVRSPSGQHSEQGARNNVERVVTRIHDPGASNKSSPEGGNQDDEGLPHLTLRVKHVKFGGEVEGEIVETSERDARVTGRKAPEAVLEDVLVGLGADRDAAQSVR